MSALLQQLRSEILAADDLGNIVTPEIARAYKVEKARVAKEEFLANAPAAPEPSATATRETTESKKLIFTGAINNPTVQVKITNDITRGFIKLKKAFV